MPFADSSLASRGNSELGASISTPTSGRAVATAVTDAYIDRDARKGTGPSDHAPVVVDLDVPQ